jgi:phosphatidylethanolamine/phosphatidyl-N-methylethanolamine N-methyltransferase
MQLDTVKKAYRRYAGVYDALFGAVLQPGRKAVIQALGCLPGDRVLEVGVGTGLSLPLYPAHTSVTGIDVSSEMLDKARERVARLELTNVVALEEMNAEAMSFADASFDKVVAMYVVSVVGRPDRLLAELRRVCRPGGEIFIVNHVRSEHPLLGGIEKALAPLSGLIGFRPDFELKELTGTHRLDQVSRVNFLWKVMRITA